MNMEETHTTEAQGPGIGNAAETVKGEKAAESSSRITRENRVIALANPPLLTFRCFTY